MEVGVNIRGIPYAELDSLVGTVISETDVAWRRWHGGLMSGTRLMGSALYRTMRSNVNLIWSYNVKKSTLTPMKRTYTSSQSLYSQTMTLILTLIEGPRSCGSHSTYIGM